MVHSEIQKFNILPFSCISWLTYSMQKVRSNRRKEIYIWNCTYYTESNLRFKFAIIEWYKSSSRTRILLVNDISTYGIDKLWNELRLHQKPIPLISEGDHPSYEQSFFTWPNMERNIFVNHPSDHHHFAQHWCLQKSLGIWLLNPPRFWIFEPVDYQNFQTWGLDTWQLGQSTFPQFVFGAFDLAIWLASSWNGAWIGWLLRCVKRALEDGDTVESEIPRSPRMLVVSPHYTCPGICNGSYDWGNVSHVFCFRFGGGYLRLEHAGKLPAPTTGHNGAQKFEKNNTKIRYTNQWRLEHEKTSIFWEFQLFVFGQGVVFCTRCGGSSSGYFSAPGNLK